MIFPKKSEAMISGNTIKKLKMPMYMPILFSGKYPASMEYGIDNIDAQAMPTMLMETYNIDGSLIYFTVNKPMPPMSRQKVCVIFLPSLATQKESVRENK